jgi:hypothetical protein
VDLSLLKKIRRKLSEHQESALIRRAETDLDELSPSELIRVKNILEVREARSRLELIDLQKQEAKFNIRGSHRDALIEQYLEQLEALNLKTPGGLRSCRAEDGEDPELVAEAWRIFCARRRGGGSRFG